MPPIARNTLAIIVGLIVTFSLVAGIEALGHIVYPVPDWLDFSKPEKVREYVEGLPLGALLFVLTAWIVATFVGGLIAALIARTRSLLFSGIIGAFVLAATLVNMMIIPHPTWFTVTGITGIVLAVLAASKLVSARSKQ